MQKSCFLLIAFLMLFSFSACAAAKKAENGVQKVEDGIADADYPLPKVIEPVAKPIATPVMETADDILKERTVRDTRQPGKPGGYRATVFPKSKSESDDGTAFKISW
jgi:hypothetical protein